MFDLADTIQRIAMLAPAMLLGVICHEVAHGYAAYLMGDPTAKQAGRLTLNPIKHLDTMGTLVFVLTSLWGRFVIGWAKPVPVNPRYFKDPRKGMMLVSLAGPGTNLVLALACALVMRLVVSVANAGPGELEAKILVTLMRMAEAGVVINLILAVFNMLPVPPLDGSKVLMGVLPMELAWRYASLERWGLLIVVLLVASGALSKVLFPLIINGYDLIMRLFGL